jgi:hypothetical protein
MIYASKFEFINLFINNCEVYICKVGVQPAILSYWS